MNGKLRVTSVRTKSVIFIPLDQVEGLRTARNGETIVDRECGVNLRVRESIEDITKQMEQLERVQTPPKAPVTHHTTLSHSSATVVMPQRGYRPQGRSESIINTVVGVGGGIVLGEIVGDLIGGLFD